MTLTTLFESKEVYSEEFGNFLADIRSDVEDYIDHYQAQKKSKMLIIGKFIEAQRQFPQRSSEFNKFGRILSNQGWNKDHINLGYSAYKEYKKLKENGNVIFSRLADEASPTILMLINRAGLHTVGYDAAMYLKRTGKVPTKNQIIQRIKGTTSEKFESRSRPKLKDAPAEKEQKEMTTRKATRATPELMRLGVTTDEEIEFLDFLIAEEKLPLISTYQEAKAWRVFNSDDLLLTILQQKIQIQKINDGLCRIEQKLWNIFNPAIDV